jgi:sarcosine oxidase subunit delta
LPKMDSSKSMVSWHKAIHARKNPRGKLREYWYHESGCEQWFEIERDTASHEISTSSGNEQSGQGRA